MSRVYAACKCDCCGVVYEGHANADKGMLLIIMGNPNYPSLAEEQYRFDDICNKCRDDFRRVIENTAIAHGWQPPPLPEPVIRPETPTEMMAVEPPPPLPPEEEIF